MHAVFLSYRYFCFTDTLGSHSVWIREVWLYVYIRVESGSDDPDNLGHLGHFLEGQVGLICKLNYLDVTWI